MGRGETIARCLESVAVNASTAFASCGDLADEFKVIRKAYHRKVLATHPDKGGDAQEFRDVQSAFEVLRNFYDRGRVITFRSEENNSTSTAEAFSSAADYFAQAEARDGTQSYDYYADAAEEDIPTYRVEPARSNRSTCCAKHKAACGETKIEKGVLRVGQINLEAGAYGRWVRLSCWRIPAKIWEGLPDPGLGRECVEDALRRMNRVMLTGMHELSDVDLAAFVDYCMDKAHWAKKQNRKPKPVDPFAAKYAPPPPATVEASTETALALPDAPGAGPVVAKAKPGGAFIMPLPGRSGVEGCMAGLTCVSTGVFPEVGGGSGLNLGKDRVKAMVQAFGGRLTGSVSGKTNILIVGKQPGMSKVSKARANPKITLMTIHDLKAGLESGDVLAAAAPVQITQFSGGFVGARAAAMGLPGNGLALTASPEELRKASGIEGPLALPDAPGAGPVAPPCQDLAFPAPASIQALQTNVICAARPRKTAVVHGDYDEIEEQCAKAASGTPAEVVAWAAYGRLRVPELGEVLAMNGQTKTGNKAFVLRKVIDGASRGAPGICDLCDRGKPKPVEDELGKWFCNGYYDDRSLSYVRCPQTWTDATLPRRQWIDTARGFGGKANPPSISLPDSFTEEAVDAFHDQAQDRPEPAPLDDEDDYVEEAPKPKKTKRARAKRPATPEPEEEEEEIEITGTKTREDRDAELQRDAVDVDAEADEDMEEAPPPKRATRGKKAKAKPLAKKKTAAKAKKPAAKKAKKTPMKKALALEAAPAPEGTRRSTRTRKATTR